jgi:hypothetical protein
MGVARAYELYLSPGGPGLSGLDAFLLCSIAAAAAVLVWLGGRAQGVQGTRFELAPRDALALRVTKTAWTFATIAILWSLWSSPSVEAWLALLRRGMRV